MAQRANAGYCACFTRPTTVALPSRYRVEEHSSAKAHGIQLWKNSGPWTVRDFAGTLYAHDSGYLPSA